MSVRSKIKEFEALSRKKSDDNSKERTNEGKRFHFPGSNTLNSEPDTQQSTGNNFITTSRSSKNIGGFQDIDVDLQEVWSVRKNIHHTGKSRSNQISSSTSSSSVLNPQAKAGLYSRHGAIAAQQTRSPQVQLPVKDSFNRGVYPARRDENLETNKRVPLQESPWNVKKSSYSYNSQVPVDGGVAKRPIRSPPVNEGSPAKRRISIGGMDGIVRPTGEQRGHPFPFRGNDISNEKVGYAKRMAQGYLKSVGMGEFTPKTSSYSKETPPAPSKQDKKNSITTTTTTTTTRWKRLDDDHDFEFDV